MRKSFDALSGLVNNVLERNPFHGDVFIFINRTRNKIKLLHWQGGSFTLYYKRLEQGRFVWPRAQSGAVHLSHAQLSMLLEGIDWRPPARRYRPQHSA